MSDSGWGSADALNDNWWLSSGESVLWRGTPDIRSLFSKQDVFLVPFTILWAGFAVFWEIGVTRSGWGFGTVWGVPFVLVGIYMVIGRFIYKRWDRKSTRYVVTIRRAVVIRRGRSLQQVSTTNPPSRIERSNRPGRGSVIWLNASPGGRLGRGFSLGSSNAWLVGSGWPGANQLGAIAFLDVDDFDRLLAALDSARGGGFFK